MESVSEKRKFRRVELACPASLHDGKGQLLAKGKSSNISNGGLFLAVPPDAVKEYQKEINLAFAVPRQTSNSYMLEDFACRATIIHAQKTGNKLHLGLAFQKPLQLDL